MTNKAQKLHDALYTALLNKIDAGEATSADLNVARQLLRDNELRLLADAMKPSSTPITEGLDLPFDIPQELEA